MSRRGTKFTRWSRIESLESREVLAAPGSLDSTFSGDGKATPMATFSGDFSATDIALQSDGKTVVIGTHVNSSGTYGAITRLLYNGQLDPTFNGGVPVLPFVPSGTNTRIDAVSIDSEGRIVVVGQSRVGNILFPEAEMLVMRFNSNGTIDDSFSDDGRILMDLGDGFSDTEGFDVAIQPDGRIVVVGTAYQIPNWDFVIVRLTEIGIRDRRIVDTITGTVYNEGFAFDGVAHVGMGGDDDGRAVKLDGNGNIYVAGNVDVSSVEAFAGLIKLGPLGGLADGFSGDGKLTFQVPGRSITVATDLMLQGDKVIIAGHAREPNGQNDFFVARFTAEGALDPSFGENSAGYTLTDLGGNDIVAGITAAPFGTGGFLVSGGSGGMAVVKYDDNGLLDGNFGNAGKLRLNMGGAANIAPGPGRRVTIAGGEDFSSARILLNGGKGVSAGALDSVAAEGTTNTAKLFVGRSERLPVSTRVFFSISGTTTLSDSRIGERDYSLSGMSLTVLTPTLGSGFVDIPINETFVIVTLSAFNDMIVEGTESAVFTIVADTNYEIGSPAGGIITIRDNDTPNLSIADLNADRTVDAADAAILFANWGTGGYGDINFDGVVDAADAAIVFAEWSGDLGPPIIAPTTAPSQSSSAFTLIGSNSQQRPQPRARRQRDRGFGTWRAAPDDEVTVAVPQDWRRDRPDHNRPGDYAKEPKHSAMRGKDPLHRLGRE